MLDFDLEFCLTSISIAVFEASTDVQIYFRFTAVLFSLLVRSLIVCKRLQPVTISFDWKSQKKSMIHSDLRKTCFVLLLLLRDAILK